MKYTLHKLQEKEPRKEPLNKHIYEAAIGLLFSDMAESVMRLYPATEDNRDNMAQIEQGLAKLCF